MLTKEQIEREIKEYEECEKMYIERLIHKLHSVLACENPMYYDNSYDYCRTFMNGYDQLSARIEELEIQLEELEKEGEAV